jgi:hypothetical protein
VAKVEFRRRIPLTAAALILGLAAQHHISLAQTALRNGNRLNFREWQPTRDQVASSEKAAGILASPEEQLAMDQDLDRIGRFLIEQSRKRSISPNTSNLRH